MLSPVIPLPATTGIGQQKDSPLERALGWVTTQTCHPGGAPVECRGVCSGPVWVCGPSAFSHLIFMKTLKNRCFFSLGFEYRPFILEVIPEDTGEGVGT